MPAKGQYRVRVSAGQHFGEWVVLADATGHDAKAPVRCSCGAERNVNVHSLVRGSSTRCQACGGREAAKAKGQQLRPRPETSPHEAFMRSISTSLQRGEPFETSFPRALTTAGINGAHPDRIRQAEKGWRTVFATWQNGRG